MRTVTRHEGPTVRPCKQHITPRTTSFSSVQSTPRHVTVDNIKNEPNTYRLNTTNTVL